MLLIKYDGTKMHAIFPEKEIFYNADFTRTAAGLTVQTSLCKIIF